jgi:hypothetical protein
MNLTRIKQQSREWRTASRAHPYWIEEQLADERRATRTSS